MKNDVYYVEHISLWLDIKIIFKTVFSVLKRENIYVTDASTKPQEKPAEAEAKAAEAQTQTETAEVGKK